MSDQSALDRKYFLSGDTYNCPFCNRRSVVYRIVDNFTFDWSKTKSAYGYIVECAGCESRSLHLSNYPLNEDNFSYTFKMRVNNELKSFKPDPEDLDSLFFLHQPTSFFTLDERIPRDIRDLVAEADGCRKMNFLVGASGALRKSIYRFLKAQGAKKQKNPKGEALSYGDQIKWVKSQNPQVPEELFSALSNIQDMVSEELHEEKDWEPWTSSQFDYMVSATKALLHEVYVTPQERKQMLERVLGLRPKSSEVKKD